LAGAPAGRGAPVIEAGAAQLGQLVNGGVGAAPETVTVVHDQAFEGGLRSLVQRDFRSGIPGPPPLISWVSSSSRASGQPRVKGSRVWPLSSTQTDLFSV